MKAIGGSSCKLKDVSEDEISGVEASLTRQAGAYAFCDIEAPRQVGRRGKHQPY